MSSNQKETTAAIAAVDRMAMIKTFAAARRQTENICRPLAIEDHIVQPVEDVSPPKWHLGHTTWFYEQVILEQFEPNFKKHHDLYYFVFNSYYEAFGDRVDRALRGTLSRPTVAEVLTYREAITDRMVNLMQNANENNLKQIEPMLRLGINHEQQHQELLLTDIKHIFAADPFRPMYTPSEKPALTDSPPLRYIPISGGIHKIGATGGVFAYDNEFPRHDTLVPDFRLANRTVTCGEWLEFIRDGGYRDHRLWLSDGWDVIRRLNWKAPLHWETRDNHWHVMTLHGLKPVNDSEPVCHISHYEAAAFARWADKRLPTEAEWEVASQANGLMHHDGFLMDDQRYHPGKPIDDKIMTEASLYAMIGDVWEWTASAYLPYPGYKQSRDPLGEYNGKFMSGQMVLRGGSCATPQSHIRTSYRNFFQPEKRWQFTGLRLADDR